VSGLFISFEGTEGCGKTTQIARLAEKLRGFGRTVKLMREPGGTTIGEEIRHTLKHSHQNAAMTPEAELLLMNASRAQLVREVIRPALAAGEIVLCDRFYDSTVAYQGHGRGLDLDLIRGVIDFAVGDTRPKLTLLLDISPETSATRLASRRTSQPVARDRFEEAGRPFFDRVAKGYRAIAAAEPERVKVVDAAGTVEAVGGAIWAHVERLI
jgi:dTMP kinase